MRQCERCGTDFEPTNYDRGGYQRFCSDRCNRLSKGARTYRRKQDERIAALKCRQCNEQITGRVKQFCSSKCRSDWHNANAPTVLVTRSCQCCYGIFVIDKQYRDRYCSKFCRGFMQETWPRPVKRPSYEPRADGLECDEAGCTRPVIARGICATHYNKRKRQNNPGKEPSSAFRKRAKQWGVAYEPVDRFKVFERDEWICQLCLKPVDPLTTDSRWRASLDHVMPMSKGGSHTYANLQLAHVSCNSRKHAKILYPGIPFLPPV